MLEGFDTWSELNKTDVVMSCNLIKPKDVEYIHNYFVDKELEDKNLYINYSYCLIACWWDAYSRFMDASYMTVDEGTIRNALDEFPIDKFME